MAVVKLGSSRNVARIMNYLNKEEPHENHEFLNGHRNLAVEGVNVSSNPGSALHQMREVQKTYGKDKGYVQAHTMIVSFTREEIDPRNPADVEKGLEICRDLQSDIYGENHQTLMNAQADNESGLFHVHMTTNNTGFDGKSVRGNQRDFKYVAERSNEIFEKHGLTPLELDLNKEDRVTSKEVQMRKRGVQPWKDVLRDRVDEVMFDNENYTYEDFTDGLQDAGVQVVRGKRDIEYKIEVDGKEHSLTARRLGSDYKEDDIRESLRQKENDRNEFLKQQQLEAQRRIEQAQEWLDEHKERERTKREESERKRRQEELERSKERNEKLERQRRAVESAKRDSRSVTRQSSERSKERQIEFER